MTYIGKPIFITGLKDQYVNEGQPVVFEVKITGNPDLVHWICNDEFLGPKDLNIKLTQRPDDIYRLSIEAATLENGGSYQVVAVNKVGKTASHAILTVTPKVEDFTKKGEKPSFVQGLEDTTVNEGFPIKLSVKVSGIPTPKLTWLRNNKEIVTKPGLIRISENPDNTANLAIHEADVTDSGLYKVIATNENGTAETKGEVKVVVIDDKDVTDEIKKKLAERSGKDDQPGIISLLLLDTHFYTLYYCKQNARRMKLC